MRYLILGLLVIGAGSVEAQVTRQAPTTAVTEEVDLQLALWALIDQPAPAGLSREDAAGYQKQTEWLNSVLTRLETAAGVRSPRDAASGMASGKRMHKPIRMTAELDVVRKAVLLETPPYRTVSNVLKTRHETAMNSIRNMK